MVRCTFSCGIHFVGLNVRDGELDICQYFSSSATFTVKLVGGHKPRLIKRSYNTRCDGVGVWG